jgi:hypothetical protein
MQQERINLSEGVDSLKWGMPFEELKSFHPNAHKRKPRLGRNPVTQEEVKVGPGIIFRSQHFSTVAGIPIDVTAGCTDQTLDEFTLTGENRTGMELEELLQCAARLGAILGADNINPDEEEQDWSVDGFEIRLLLSAKQFAFVIRPEDPETLLNPEERSHAPVALESGHTGWANFMARMRALLRLK